MYKDGLISNISPGRNKTFSSFKIKDIIIRNSHLIDFNSTKQKQKSYVLRNHLMG